MQIRVLGIPASTGTNLIHKTSQPERSAANVPVPDTTNVRGCLGGRRKAGVFNVVAECCVPALPHLQVYRSPKTLVCSLKKSLNILWFFCKVRKGAAAA